MTETKACTNCGREACPTRPMRLGESPLITTTAYLDCERAKSARLEGELESARRIAEYGVRLDALVIASCVGSENDDQLPDSVALSEVRRLRVRAEKAERALEVERSARDAIDEECNRLLQERAAVVEALGDGGEYAGLADRVRALAAATAPAEVARVTTAVKARFNGMERDGDEFIVRMTIEESPERRAFWEAATGMHAASGLILAWATPPIGDAVTVTVRKG